MRAGEASGIGAAPDLRYAFPVVDDSVQILLRGAHGRPWRNRNTRRAWAPSPSVYGLPLINSTSRKATAMTRGTRATKTVNGRSRCRMIAISAVTPPARPQTKPIAAPLGTTAAANTNGKKAAANPAAHQPRCVVGRKVIRGWCLAGDPWCSTRTLSLVSSSPRRASHFTDHGASGTPRIGTAGGYGGFPGAQAGRDRSVVLEQVLHRDPFVGETGRRADTPAASRRRAGDASGQTRMTATKTRRL